MNQKTSPLQSTTTTQSSLQDSSINTKLLMNTRVNCFLQTGILAHKVESSLQKYDVLFSNTT